MFLINSLKDRGSKWYLHLDQSEEMQKHAILEYLRDEFKKEPTDMTDDETIAEHFNYDKTEVIGRCILLQQDGLIDLVETAGSFRFYRINSRGMRYLSSHSQTNTPRPGLSPEIMKEIGEKSMMVFEAMKPQLIANLLQTAQENSLSNGLYYIVLIDLSKSTVAATKMKGSEYQKWLNDFTQISKNGLSFPHKNVATYIDTSGDGVLLLFCSFYEMLTWKNRVNEMCSEYNRQNTNKPNFFPYNTKTIIHLGEVYFDSDKLDTKSFAVNVVFKIEKKFQSGDLGITEAVRQAIITEINAHAFDVTTAGNYSPDEGGISIPLWKLSEIR